MSTTRDQPVSRIPLSVKNIPTQDAVNRDATLLRKPALTQQPPKQSMTAAATQYARPRTNVSRLPSFVSRSHLGLDRSNQENVPLVAANATPKKRAIPIDESHPRNVVVDSPSKRSRSSKSGTDSSNTEQSVGAALASDLNGIRVNDSRRLPQPSQAAEPPARLRRPEQAPAPTTSATTSTSVRTNRTLREPTEEFAPEARRRQSEQEVWRQKFTRAFPNFVFHFDSVDDSTARKYTAHILKLGGRVEPFFSNKVTHVITTRRVPDGSALEEINTNAGAAEKSSAHKLFRPSFLATRTSTVKTGANAARSRPIPLYSERNPLQERPARQYGPNDLLIKAQGFGIKVWQFEKLQNILMRLMKVSPRDLEASTNVKQDLSQMLEKEKVFGSTERDPAAARSTWHYFEKSACYVLVEDATLEYRPIMCTEFQYTREDRAQRIPPPWPMVYGQTPGRCPFTYYPPKRSVPKEEEGEGPSAPRLSAQLSLRRAVSLNNMARSNLGPAFRPHVPPIRTANDTRQQDYPMASGNSVSITSNIASTTSNIFTDQQNGATVGLPQNRRVAELNRRVHTSNAPIRPPRMLHASPASVLAGSAASGVGIRRDGGSPLPGSPLPGSPAAQRGDAEQGASVRRMLGLEDKERRVDTTIPGAGSGLQRSVSTSAVNKPASAKKPGYCENCRAKYEDFIEHIYDRKHRKFATNEANFVDIDALIGRVARPLRPVAVEYYGFGLEEIPSSQPEERGATYAESEEASVSAGSPEVEGDAFDCVLRDEQEADDEEEEEEQREEAQWQPQPYDVMIA
ncbi:Zinc finger, DBF-type [Kalmanozyma brasiliensis GHG001]|uniref:DBF4-type domain-containing protein n=1 Tax=Kalmanozyma brasiliensis (strain GHG001) TaxID=1365824 RepID=V5GVT3_KALBG|nr:Zinc finger, DBF-type [Kalmanozyma brasiliensis GHG001]EST10007.1 Zinc finger, DBF-type [Kalmanozyma brasiliensis GHG001]